jgi:hypothetical protein
LLGTARPAGDDNDDWDPLDSIASDAPDPDDRAARRERVVRSGEALQALKPQEVRALTLKAQGYSYAEIGEITGWTYTKINRCMAEGRKRFLQVFAEIEQGQRCEELSSALSDFADGEHANGKTEAVEFHLRSCERHHPEWLRPVREDRVRFESGALRAYTFPLWVVHGT